MPEKKGSSRDFEAITFGLILKRLRMQKGWTLQQLSRVSGYHANYLGVMERGGNSPSLQSFMHLCNWLGEDPSVIMKEIVDTRAQFRKRPKPEPMPEPEPKLPSS